MQVSFFLSLGLFPFHFWVQKVLVDLTRFDLCLFLGPMKFGLLFLLVSLASHSLVLPLVSLFWGAYLIFISSGLPLILYSSGSCLVLWLVLLGQPLFFRFYVSYLLSLVPIGLFGLVNFSPVVAFLGLGGLPPLPFFWGKFLAISLLPSSWSFFFLCFSSLLFYPYLSFSLSLSRSESTSPLALFRLCILSWYVVSVSF